MARVLSRIENAWGALRRYGPLEYSRRLARHFGESIHRHHAGTIYRRDLAGPVVILDPSMAAQFEFYSAQRHADLQAFLSPFVRRDVIEARLQNGWTPLMAYLREKVVSISWFATRPLYLESLECYMDYGEGSGYIEGSRTDVSVRGMGFAPALRSRICRHLRELGCTQVYVCVGDDNTASRAVAAKCGFEPFESIKLTRTLWHRRYICTRHVTTAVRQQNAASQLTEETVSKGTAGGLLPGNP